MKESDAVKAARRELGVLVRTERVRRGMNTSTFAAKCNLSKRGHIINRIECGRGEYKIDLIRQVIVGLEAGEKTLDLINSCLKVVFPSRRRLGPVFRKDFV